MTKYNITAFSNHVQKTETVAFMDSNVTDELIIKHVRMCIGMEAKEIHISEVNE